MGNKDKKVSDAVENGSVALVGGVGAVIPSSIFVIGGAAAGIIQGIPKIRELYIKFVKTDIKSAS